MNDKLSKLHEISEEFRPAFGKKLQNLQHMPAVAWYNGNIGRIILEVAQCFTHTQKKRTTEDKGNFDRGKDGYGDKENTFS